VIGAQHVAEKNTQRDERRIDAINPADRQRCQRLFDQIRAEDVAEREIAILQELMLQMLDLLPKPAFTNCRIDGLLAEISLVDNLST
jgi:hypothetical protein